MLTDADRAEIRAMIRDEIVDAAPPKGGGAGDGTLQNYDRSPAALTFEIRFLRRELEALTKELHNITNNAE
jgi:hypothetical protein